VLGENGGMSWTNDDDGWWPNWLIIITIIMKGLIVLYYQHTLLCRMSVIERSTVLVRVELFMDTKYLYHIWQLLVIDSVAVRFKLVTIIIYIHCPYYYESSNQEHAYNPRQNAVEAGIYGASRLIVLLSS
jgi:hypothetical protein